jgi:hypothetical protein
MEHFPSRHEALTSNPSTTPKKKKKKKILSIKRLQESGKAKSRIGDFSTFILTKSPYSLMNQ